MADHQNLRNLFLRKKYYDEALSTVPVVPAGRIDGSLRSLVGRSFGRS